MSHYYQKIQADLNQEVAEMIPQYGVSNDTSSAVSFRDLLHNKLLLSTIIQRGVSYVFFKKVRQLTPFGEKDWASFLGVSTKSLQRYEKEHRRFKPLQTEKIIEMAEVMEIGMEVFDNMDKLKLWMDTPNFALGHSKPVDLIKDSYGKELVVAELTRVSHGIFV